MRRKTIQRTACVTVMVRVLRSLSSGRAGIVEMQNGSEVAVTGSYTPSQTAEQNYMAQWFDALLPVLPRHSGR